MHVSLFKRVRMAEMDYLRSAIEVADSRAESMQKKFDHQILHLLTVRLLFTESFHVKTRL